MLGALGGASLSSGVRSIDYDYVTGLTEFFEAAVVCG
jgi:hypothetical protein